MESLNNPTPPSEDAPKQPHQKTTEIPKHLFSNNPHEVLDVPKTASGEEIKEAKISLQKNFHPDVNENPHATEASKNINIAFDTLRSDTNQGNRRVMEKESSKMVVASGEIKLGAFSSYPRDVFVSAQRYAKLKNVKAKFSHKKADFFGNTYKIELTGGHKEVQEILDYLRNKLGIRI